MSYKFIECTEPEASVRRIILNRPDKRNALCNPLRKELFDCLEKFDADPNIKAIIISGNGSCFCAGYDLSYDNSEDLPYHSSKTCLLYTSPSPRDGLLSRMPSSA